MDICSFSKHRREKLVYLKNKRKFLKYPKHRGEKLLFSLYLSGVYTHILISQLKQIRCYEVKEKKKSFNFINFCLLVFLYIST